MDRRVVPVTRSVTMGDVTSGKRATSGRHAGPARLEDPAPKKPRSSTGSLLLLALGITAAVVAWGYLVWAAGGYGRATSASAPRQSQ